MVTKRKKLIDKMQEQLLASGHTVRRDGWRDGVPSEKKDWCEWLDIKLFSKDKKHRYIVHLYFEKNATILTDAHVYKSKKKKGYTADELVALKKGDGQSLKEEVKSEPIINPRRYTIVSTKSINGIA